MTALGTAGAIAVAGCTDNGEQTDGDTPESGMDDDPESGMDDDEESPTSEGEDETGEEENGIGEEAQYELRIHVVDMEEVPVEGASIDIEDEDGEDAHDDTVETDEEGQAIVELGDGMYTVHVRANGFADAEEDVTIDGADEELMVQLEEGDGEEDEVGDEEDE